MKITIEIEVSDKYEPRNLYLFAGNEPIWRKKFNKDYAEIKITECSRCGKCCEDIDRPPFGKGPGCDFLFNDGSEKLCNVGPARSIGLHRPHACAISDPKHLKSCTVKWMEYKT